MSIAFSDITIPTTAGRSSSQAKIAGSIPLPRAASAVLLSNGKAIVSETTVSEGKVLSEGKIVLDVICADTEGELFSFTSEAGFSHTIDCDGAKQGMKAFVIAQIISVEMQPASDDESLTLNAVADIMCRVEDNSPKKMLSAAGNTDTELECICESYKKREVVGKAVTRLREDIVANEISSVVYASANAVIRDVQCIVDNARVDGILSLCALCYGKNDKLFRFQQNIPFTADVETDYDNCPNMTGRVEVSDIRVRMTGDEYGLATVDAQLSIELSSSSVKEAQLVVDAFSPSEPFECTKRDIQALLYKETVEQKAICREQFTTIRDMNSYSETAFSDVRPVISCATKTDEGVIVDGIAYVSLIYADGNGGLHSASDELPFSVNIPALYDNIELDAKAICTGINVMGVGESGIDISMTLHITADLYEIRDISIVESVSPTERRVMQKGFIVCFAEEGETAYDIAKRFNVSRKSLAETNKSMQSVLHHGDKAIVLV